MPRLLYNLPTFFCAFTACFKSHDLPSHLYLCLIAFNTAGRLIFRLRRPNLCIPCPRDEADVRHCCSGIIKYNKRDVADCKRVYRTVILRQRKSSHQQKHIVWYKADLAITLEQLLCRHPCTDKYLPCLKALRCPMYSIRYPR